MDANYTLLNLVRKTYGELNTAQQIEIKSIEKQYPRIAHAATELMQVKQMLDNGFEKPSAHSTQLILDYSCNSHKLGV